MANSSNSSGSLFCKSVQLEIIKENSRYNTAHDPAVSVEFAPDGKSLCAILQKENTVALFQVVKQESGYELKHISNAVDFLPGAGTVQKSSGRNNLSFLFSEHKQKPSKRPRSLFNFNLAFNQARSCTTSTQTTLLFCQI